MKLSKMKLVGLGVAIAASLTTAANAQVVYSFEQGTYTTYPSENPPLATPAASGTIVLSALLGPGTYSTATYMTSFSFMENPPGAPADNTYSGSTFTVLSDGDLVLNGNFTGAFGTAVYQSATGASAPNENYVIDNGVLGGDWVPVPEPSSIMAGVMLLLPFGASTMRSLRRKVTL